MGIPDTGTIFWLVLVVVGVVVVFGTLIAAMKRYKKCPSDKILVIYGRTGKKADGSGAQSARCIHGGAAFVWPLIQDYEFMDLQPIQIDIPLKGALSKQNIRINVPSSFTVGISTEPDVMTNAAERLLGLNHESIKKLAEDIIFGQLRVVIATMDIEEINADRDKFIENVMKSVGAELMKIGLKNINVNAKDITDESGYIEALGKKAAAEAINKAKVEVAKQERDGDIGAAEAQKEKEIQVANANAEAVTGKNTAKVIEANSHADRREKEAEATRKGEAADLVKKAAAQEEGYEAQRLAELKRAEKEEATRQADVIVPAKIAKEELVIKATAQMEQDKLRGEGEGAEIKAKMTGEAEGFKAILTKKAEGFDAIVKAAQNSADKAATLMIVEQLPTVAGVQAKAISQVKFDKVVVMDSGDNGNGEGSTTAKWLSSFTKMLPGIHDVAEMSGVQLPELLGKLINPTNPLGGTPVAAAKATKAKIDKSKTPKDEIVVEDPPQAQA